MVFVIKLLSAIGVINPILEKFRKENIVISTQESLLDKKQIVFNYMDSYDQYVMKVHEIMEGYNEGRLGVNEVYDAQKMLTDSISFTKESLNPLLVGLNEAIISYHDNLISWLDTLVHPEQETINEAVLKLNGNRNQIMNELVKVFNQVGIAYQYNDDSSISYQRMNIRMK